MYKRLIRLFILFSSGLLICGSTLAGGGLENYIASRAIGFSRMADLDLLVEKASGRKLVLLGEASHGTHEYYAWRDSISRSLIAGHGFRFVAVEGDWASLYELNRYVKNMPGAASSAGEVLRALGRWPLWMWGNEEVVAFAEWIRSYNDGVSDDQKVGFYGMDVYDEWRSKDVLLEMLASHDKELYDRSAGLLACMMSFNRDSWAYARNAAGSGKDCTEELAELYNMVGAERGRLIHMSDDDFFNLRQNARVVKNAEKFYRKSFTRRDASSWNSRVRHMHATVSSLLNSYGEGAKGIVWAHNTHIGDARFTDMVRWGQENIGHLSRELHSPEEVFLVGFTTFTGRVQAGSEWGGRRQRMNIPRAARGSIEHICYSTGLRKFALVFNDDDRSHHDLTASIGHRAVGVVYNPDNDHRQFVPSIIPLRYDAFIFFRETNALTPLH